MAYYSLFDQAREARAIAKPKGMVMRYALNYSLELIPTTEQVSLAEKYKTGYPCRTRAGRPRALHSRDRSGTCIFCGHTDPSLDRPLGETSH